MKKLSILFVCLFAMLAASMSTKAQEVTIVLNPGWTWIGYPGTDTLNIATSFGDFTPMRGDIIKSQWGQSYYMNGLWFGRISQLYPGYGYMYKSNRTEPVTLTFNAQQPTPQVVVNTSEPTDITTTSAVVGGTVTIAEGNHVFARGVCWSTEEMPTVDGSHMSGEAVAGSQSVTLDGLTSGTIYYVRAYVVSDCGLAYGNQQSFTTEYQYVNLGLPSGTLWATFNVGANSPEQPGNYFAWGETQPKENYDWGTYQYCNGSENTLTKYCTNSSYGNNGFFDNLRTLLPEDDAATANWGGDWRTPTWEEWQELYNYTTCTWTTQNGVYGRLFTSPNGNSIFLPAAGYYIEGSLNNVDNYGIYWSSSLNTDKPSWSGLLFFNLDDYYASHAIRSFGRSVRPVQSALPNTTFYIIDAIANPEEGAEISGVGTYQEGSICTLTAMPHDGYVFINWTEDGEEVSNEETYSFTVTSNRTLVANYIYFEDGDLYVDLGLPSGLLWATCNLGADAPEDYGDYFAWGETQPKNTYYWGSYQYCNGSDLTLTKYCNNSGYGYNGFTDNLTTLLPEDDAATANWGNDWRMPTREEWQELYNNTTVTWTTQNGVNGWLFTAANDNTLFLPAAGCRYYGTLFFLGNRCYYWSSSLHTNPPAYAWYFYSDLDISGVFVEYRDYGLSVRPVRDAMNSVSTRLDGKGKQ